MNRGVKYLLKQSLCCLTVIMPYEDNLDAYLPLDY